MSASSEFRSPFEQVRPAPPVPVLLLADVSGSMFDDGKIQVLNSSVRAMIRDLAGERTPNGEVVVGVVTFGDDAAELHLPLTPADQVRWTDLTTGGNTPLGLGLDRIREVLEDEAALPTRSATPTVIIASDGVPTDRTWRESLHRLLASPRAARSLRLAVAIGSDVGQASYDVLREIVTDPDHHVVRAAEVDRLPQFFRSVTRAVTTYVHGGNLDQAPVFDPDELYDLTD